jgi:hypothetical protein
MREIIKYKAQKPDKRPLSNVMYPIVASDSVASPSVPSESTPISANLSISDINVKQNWLPRSINLW